MFGRWNKFFKSLDKELKKIKFEKDTSKSNLTDREKFEESKTKRQFHEGTPDCWYCSRKWECKNSCSNLGHDSKICNNFKY